MIEKVKIAMIDLALLVDETAFNKYALVYRYANDNCLYFYLLEDEIELKIKLCYLWEDEIELKIKL